MSGQDGRHTDTIRQSPIKLKPPSSHFRSRRRCVRLCATSLTLFGDEMNPPTGNSTNDNSKQPPQNQRNHEESPDPHSPNPEVRENGQSHCEYLSLHYLWLGFLFQPVH